MKRSSRFAGRPPRTGCGPGCALRGDQQLSLPLANNLTRNRSGRWWYTHAHTIEITINRDDGAVRRRNRRRPPTSAMMAPSCFARWRLESPRHSSKPWLAGSCCRGRPGQLKCSAFAVRAQRRRPGTPPRSSRPRFDVADPSRDAFRPGVWPTQPLSHLMQQWLEIVLARFARLRI